MSSHGQHVDAMVDELVAAAARDDWSTVAGISSQLLALDPDHELGRRFADLASARLGGGGVAPDERRQMTILFADMVDSTPISQQVAPDELRVLLRRYRSICSTAIADHDGRIASWSGDGFMAYFGYPVPHEDAAVRAVVAGWTLLQRLDQVAHEFRDRFGVDVAARVGVHTGLVVVAEMGDGASGELVGDTPNIASRVESAADPGSVFISSTTQDLVRGFVEVDPVGARQLKGVGDPVELYRVVRPSDASRFEAWGGGRSPLIGRRDELETARRALLDADGALVAITGEAGIGKTRLVHELRGSMADRNVLLFACSESSSMVPLAPFRAAILRAAELAPGTDPPGGFDRLAAVFTPRVDAGDPRIVRLAILLGVSPPSTAELRAQTPEQSLRDIVSLLVDWLSVVGRESPAVLVVDDAHWIDPTSIDTLLQCREAVPHVPLIVTSRPDDTAGALLSAATVTVALSPLGTDEISQLLRELVPDADEDELVMAAGRSDGVPLFAEELGRVLGSESGVGLADVPRTLHDLLTRRLDTTADAKVTAQLAASIGREFELDLLGELVDAATLERHTKELIDAGIWVGDPGDTQLHFRHALLADAAYDSQVSERKREVHSAIADTIAATFPEIAAAEPHRVAFHLERGGRPLEAAAAWLQAGMATAGRGAPLEAVHHFERGLAQLELIEPSPMRAGVELGLRLGFGASLSSTVGYGNESVSASFKRALDICRELGNAPELFPALWGLWSFHLTRAEYDEALQLSVDCAAIAEETGDDALLIEARTVEGMTHFYRGEIESARTLLRDAIDRFERTRAVSPTQQFQHPAVAAASHLALAEHMLGDADAAASAIEWGLELAGACEPHLRMHARGFAATFGAALTSMLDDGDATLSHAQEAIDVCVEYGSQVFLAGGEMYKGYAQVLTGAHDEGRARLEGAADMYVLTGARLMRQYHLSMVARARLAHDDIDGALDALDEAVEAGRASNELALLPRVLHLRGRTGLRADGERRAAAVADLEEALALARRTGDVVTELAALVDLDGLDGRSMQAEVRDLLPRVEASKSGDLERARSIAAR